MCFAISLHHEISKFTLRMFRNQVVGVNNDIWKFQNFRFMFRNHVFRNQAAVVNNDILASGDFKI